MLVDQAQQKIKYNRIISVPSLKKSFIRLIIKQKKWNYNSKIVSFRDILRLNKTLENQENFITNFLALKTKREFLNLLLLESLADEITVKTKLMFLPGVFNYRNLKTTHSNFFLLSKLIKKNSMLFNITEKLTNMHEKLLLRALQPLMDIRSLNLIQILIRTNYINLKYNFHTLSFILNFFSYKEFVWSILSPILIHLFSIEFDIFLNKLNNTVSKKLDRNKNISYGLVPFQGKKNLISVNKTKIFEHFRFINCYLFNFSLPSNKMQILLFKIQIFLQTTYLFSHSIFFPINSLNLKFFGFQWKKDKKVKPTISENDIQNFLENQQIFRKNGDIKQFKVLPVHWLTLEPDIEIISYFSSIIKKLYFFYKQKGNLTILKKYLFLCRLSCALTLASKYKLKNTQQVFKKFSRKLCVYNKKTSEKKKLFLPYIF